MSMDASKPPASGLLISADHRANFLATQRAGFLNYTIDPLFELWAAGLSAVPTAYTLAGAGATITRDTTVSRFGVGDGAPRVTYGSATVQLMQEILSAGDFDDYFDARNVTAGMFVHASSSGIARVRIDDGPDSDESSLNASANTLEFLAVEHEVNAAATRLRIEGRLESAGSCTFSGPVFFFSDIMPDRFYPPAAVPPITIPFRRKGTLAVETGVGFWMPNRPFIVREVQLWTPTTGPVGADLIVDSKQWDGAAYTSMFSSRPTIADGADVGQSSSFVSIPLRAFDRYSGTGALVAGQGMRVDVDQVGSTTPGDDLHVFVRAEGFMTPAELFKAQ